MKDITVNYENILTLSLLMFGRHCFQLHRFKPTVLTVGRRCFQLRLCGAGYKPHPPGHSPDFSNLSSQGLLTSPIGSVQVILKSTIFDDRQEVDNITVCILLFLVT